MAEPTLTCELTSLLEALPRPHLIEVTRRAALGGFQAACQRMLNGKPLESVLAELFPRRTPAQILEVANEMRLCAVRNQCWSDILSLPEESKVPIRCLNPSIAKSLRERTGPAIVAFWHMGASHMMAIGLQTIGVPGLIFSRSTPPKWFRRAVSPEMRMAVTAHDPKMGILALKMGLDQLRSGGVVALAIDGTQGQRDFFVSFLGRKIPLSRGVAAMARLTGAPIYPAVITWRNTDWSLDFRLYDPVALPVVNSMSADAWEQEALNALARQFEVISRAFPGQTRLERLAGIAKAPRVEGSG